MSSKRAIKFNGTNAQKLKALFFLTVFLFCSLVGFAAKTAGADTLNRFDSRGERTGYWIVSTENKAVEKTSRQKSREGCYIKGRKYGVWIAYFEDGKTPRLIGEYADNRPSGAYFRFDTKGTLVQAGSSRHRQVEDPVLEVSNAIFSCKMLFDNKDMVAGQVFFSRKVFEKSLALQFWTDNSVASRVSTDQEGDYNWLSVNYNNILMTYLKIRTPKSNGVNDFPITQSTIAANRDLRVVEEAKQHNYYLPPVIRQPRVAKGLVFAPNGLNKLYTENNEIWMDGNFISGRLYSGKVFIYDRDGILLKVRVYKDGVYESDGVL